MPSVRRVTRPDLVTVVVPIDNGADKVSVTIDRQAATPALVARLSTAEPGLQELAVCEILAQLIWEWDLTETDDADSPPYPIDAESLAALPSSFLAGLMTAIGEVNRPPEATSSSFAPG